MLHSICLQIWKTQQWPQDWKRSVSFHSQRKAMPKKVQTTTQLHSSHTVQFSSVAQSCPTFCNPMDCSMPGFSVITNSWSLLKLMSIESVMPSNHLILCHLLLLLSSIFPSISVFSNDSALHIRWPKYWSFGFNISPSNEHLGLISFRMDWLGLLAVQGTLKSLFQHNSKHQYFSIQFSL